MRTILDAHHHIWNPVSNQPDIGYRWLKDIGAPKPFGDPTPIQRDYLLQEFLDEFSPNGRIAASVHVQADGAIPDPVVETQWVDGQARELGHQVAIVGFVDLCSPEAERTILRHMAQDSFRGVRQIISRLDNRPELSFAPEEYLDNPLWRENFKQVEQHGLSFDLQLYPEQMAKAVEFFSDFPAVRVIIDHAGSPHDQSEEGLRLWQQAIERAAMLPNLFIKLGGFGMFDKDWSQQSIAWMVHAILDLFGPDRVMFGSNFPVEKLAKSYGELVNIISGLIPSEDIQQRVFYDNARRVYRF